MDVPTIRPIYFALALALAVCSIFPSSLRAQEIDGVQPAAIDQPRINLLLRRQPQGPPLSANVGGEVTFNVEAYLDTGASEVLISTDTADSLGIKHEQAGVKHSDVTFNDVGVGGDSQFAVSEPLFLALANYTPTADVNDKDSINVVYNQRFGPLRTEVGPLGLMSGLMSMLTGDLDVAGMPAMQGKIVVMQLKDVNNFTDKIQTFIYDAKSRATASPPIPKTTRHVQLTYASFARFTQTTPAGAPGPLIADNPFVGPNPFGQVGNRLPPIVASHHGKSIAGSWLLDTGAAASMISQHEAAALGITYVNGTYGTNDAQLLGVPADKQFTLSVGGIGGMAKSAGFYMDKLTLPTREGKPITFLHAPVLVSDITVKDPTTGKSFTLDGVFGMNFMVASAKITGDLLPDIDNLTPGAFKWIVFDQPAGLLGFD
jgi:hypothetical protein